METLSLDWSKLVTLSEEEIKKLQDNTPGVYRISEKGSDGKYYVFYIGKSDNLKNTLLKNISDLETNLCLRQRLSQKSSFSFRYAVVTREEVRSAAERQMYKYYAPECNKQEPEGSLDIQVTLN